MLENEEGLSESGGSPKPAEAGSTPPPSAKKKDVQKDLADDAGTKLSFWWTGGKHFRLVISDDGGYGSVQFTKKNWRKVRKKINQLVKKHVKEN